MHELSIAESLAARIDDLRVANAAQGVASVLVRIGCFSGVQSDALALAFSLVCEQRGWSGTVLTMEDVPAQLHCLDCGAIAETYTAIVSCPRCGGENLTITGGQDLILQRMELTASHI